MKKNPERQGGRGRAQAVQHHHGMDPHVSLGVKLGRLGHPLHSLDLRQHLLEELCSVKQLKALPGTSFGEYLQDLVAHALRTHLADLRRLGSNGFRRTRIKSELQARRKTNRPQHPQAVFAEAFVRIADGTHPPGIDVGLTAHIIEHLFLHRIVEKAVEGEVAPQHVLLGSF